MALVVVTVPRLVDETIDQLAVRVGHDWGVGTKEEDRGVVTVQNPCLSGGMIEVFLDPVVAAPRVLAGSAEASAAVAAAAADLGDGATLDALVRLALRKAAK